MTPDAFRKKYTPGRAGSCRSRSASAAGTLRERIVGIVILLMTGGRRAEPGKERGRRGIRIESEWSETAESIIGRRRWVPPAHFPVGVAARRGGIMMYRW